MGGILAEFGEGLGSRRERERMGRVGGGGGWFDDDDARRQLF